jgi:hypothetical protein
VAQGLAGIFLHQLETLRRQREAWFGRARAVAITAGPVDGRFRLDWAFRFAPFGARELQGQNIGLRLELEFPHRAPAISQSGEGDSSAVEFK